MNRLLCLTLLLVAATAAHAQRMPITTTSDAARAHFVRGVDAVANVEGAASVAHFDAALDADPAFAQAHLYRALASSEGRDEHMRLAAEGRASDGERQLVEGYAAHLDGDHDREIALLRGLAERFPDDPVVHLWLANTESNEVGDAAGAATARRGIAAAPGYAPLYNTLGYAEMAQGNDDAAEQAFRDYIRLAPDRANPYDSYGEFLLGAGRLDEAEAQYRLAIAKNPAFDPDRVGLARVGIAKSNDRFMRAVAAGDADAVAALYTAGAVAYPPGAPPVRGREAIRDLFASFVANGVDGVTLETHEVRAMGNYALEYGTGRISVGGEDGDPFSLSVLWLKDGDEWRLHRDIWNSDGPATASASR